MKLNIWTIVVLLIASYGLVFSGVQAGCTGEVRCSASPDGSCTNNAWYFEPCSSSCGTDNVCTHGACSDTCVHTTPPPGGGCSNDSGGTCPGQSVGSACGGGDGTCTGTGDTGSDGREICTCDFDDPPESTPTPTPQIQATIQGRKVRDPGLVTGDPNLTGIPVSLSDPAGTSTADPFVFDYLTIAGGIRTVSVPAAPPARVLEAALVCITIAVF